MTSPKGSGQAIGNNRPAASPRNSGLLILADLADELDMRLGEKRLDFRFEVVSVDMVDLGGDLYPHAGRAAIRIARSGAFSGEMRPRKAR